MNIERKIGWVYRVGILLALTLFFRAGLIKALVKKHIASSFPFDKTGCTAVCFNSNIVGCYVICVIVSDGLVVVALV
jgi:hypothetical protein